MGILDPILGLDFEFVFCRCLHAHGYTTWPGPCMPWYYINEVWYRARRDCPHCKGFGKLCISGQDSWKYYGISIA